MKTIGQICYTSKYSKLILKEHTTVRWLTSRYVLGGLYEEEFVSSNLFHQKFHKGTVRVVKLEIKKLSDLTDEFIRADADCDRDAFFKMMHTWYGQKPDWKEWDSEVQIISLERIE